MAKKKKSKMVTIYDMRRIEMKLDRVLSVVEKFGDTIYSSKGVMIVERSADGSRFQ